MTIFGFVNEYFEIHTQLFVVLGSLKLDKNFSKHPYEKEGED